MSIEINIVEEIAGQEISQICLKNCNGIVASFLTLGATWQEFLIPQEDGSVKNIVMGFDKPSDYTRNTLCAGQTIGRVAGRIGRAEAKIEDTIHQLPKNNNENCLHGGPNGFHTQNWDYSTTEGVGFTSVTFYYHAKQAIDNFPGDLLVEVTMTLDDNNRLTMLFKGTGATESTLFNPTSHPYFNLSQYQDLLTHQLQINADYVLDTNDDLIPSGNFYPVTKTAYDFRVPKSLGEAIIENKGFDDAFVIKSGSEKPVAQLIDIESGDSLKIYSVRQGLVMYTMNVLEEGVYFSRDHGKEARRYQAVALEAQALPDAINHSNFDPIFIHPNEIKEYSIVFEYDNVK